MTNFVRAATGCVLAILCLFFALLCRPVKIEIALQVVWIVSIIMVLTAWSVLLLAATERENALGGLTAALGAFTAVNLITGGVLSSFVSGFATLIMGLRYWTSLRHHGVDITFRQLGNAIAIECLALTVPIGGALIWYH